MYKSNLIILILIIILIIILDITFDQNVSSNNNVPNINKIDINNNIIKIDKVNKNFHKKFFSSYMSDDELKKIDINKGSLTIQTIINENGGSANYNKFYIDSNISDNTINYGNNYLSYIK